jgi:putative ABC transport system permease protein
MLQDFTNDLRLAARSLIREPGFAFLAIVTLALGIAATTAMFGILHSVLFRPLPYPQPDRLVAVWELSERGDEMAVALPNFTDWRDRSRSFTAVAAHTQAYETTVLGAAEPLRVPFARVSRDFFTVMGVQPLLGRTFVAEEQVPGAAAALVVSDAFWRTHLGAERDLGSIRLDVLGEAARVVGVMPPGFDHPRGVQVWHPLDITPAAGLGTRTAHNFRVTARLAPGVTADAAMSELAMITDAIRRSGEAPDAVGAAVRGLQEDGVAGARRLLVLLFGAAALVLIVACTNLSSALLARASGRTAELAVRGALGASRARLVRQLLTEALLVAGLGAAAGAGLAVMIIRGLILVGPDAVPGLAAVRLDATSLAFTTGLAVVAALAVGAWPAFRATVVAPQQALRESRGTESVGQRRAWAGLVGAQVALTVLLLLGSGLLVRSFINVVRVDPGFDAERALVALLSLPASRFEDGAARARYYDELISRARALPGVRDAGIINTVPLAGFNTNGMFTIDADEPVTGIADYRVVSPDLFSAMGTTLRRGRGFTDADRGGATDVAIINSRMAERYFPGQDPIGRRFRTGGMDSRGEAWTTIIGVVDDVHHRALETEPSAAYYLSYAQRTDRIGSAALVMRTHGSPLAAVAPVRDLIRELDADVPVRVQPMATLVGESLVARRFSLLVLAAFAATALLLAGIGIHGVIALGVARRAPEIGIRMALGAAAGSVLWTVSRATLTAVALGAAIGGLAALGLVRLTASMLFGVEPLDPMTWVAVLAIVAAAATTAALLPARRATRVSPMLVMRG